MTLCNLAISSLSSVIAASRICISSICRIASSLQLSQKSRGEGCVVLGSGSTGVGADINTMDVEVLFVQIDDMVCRCL